MRVSRFFFFGLILVAVGCGGGDGGSPQPPASVLSTPSNGIVLPPGQEAEIVVELSASRANETVVLMAPNAGPSGTFVDHSAEGPNTFRGTVGADGKLRATIRSNDQAGPFLVSMQIENSPVHETLALTNGPIDPRASLTAQAARAEAVRKFLKSPGHQLNGPFLIPAGAEIGAFEGFTPVAATSWFFWLDTKPNARFQHATKFITVPVSDAAPGFIDRASVADHQWFPYVKIGGGEPTELLSALLLNDRPAATLPFTGNTTSPEHSCAIVIYGSGCGGANTDAARFAGWLVGSGRVNAPNVKLPPKATTPKELYDMIDAAKASGCKKLYLYIAAHGRPGQLSLSGKDKSGEGKPGVISYTNIASALVGLDEVCVAIDACSSGTAVQSFQNLGLSGSIVTATDPQGTSDMDPEDGMTSQWTYQFLECAQLLQSNVPGRPTFKEIQDCVKERGNATVKAGNPSSGVIGSTDAHPTPIPRVGVLKAGQTATVTITRPTIGTVDHSLTATLTIGDAGVATFSAGGSTTTIVFAAGETQKSVTINGVADGTTFYELRARTYEGNLIVGGPADIDVGSSYRFSPETIELLVGETREVALYRFGVLTKHSHTSTADLSTGSSSIAAPASTSLAFGDGTVLRLINITAGFQVGTTSITATDQANGLTATIAVNVVQEVVLEYALVAPDGTRFNKGAAIRTSRITGAHVAAPDTGCDFWHLHSHEGVFIDGHGPINDPAPTSCGFGRVIQPQ